MDFPCLFAQPNLVSPDHQGQVMMILQNFGNEDITIPRYWNIGCIENGKNPYFDKIMEVKSNEWEAKDSVNAKLPEPEPMSHEEKEKILAWANINVPNKEKSQHKELLWKHNDVISKDKRDLGKANIFEYKINLKEDSPVYIKQF